MMSRILPGLLLALVATVCGRAHAAPPQIAAYYDGGMPVAQIPAARINDLIYAFGEPNDAGGCKAPTATQLATFAALRQLRQRHPGLRLIVSIGGWDAAPQYSDIALSTRSRGRFAASCVQAFLLRQGFDGIDIDWEFPVHGGMSKSRPRDRADATALVREFRRRLDVLGREQHRHYFLTVATPAGTWQQGGAYSVNDSYDLAALAQSVDWLNVMTYDMNTIFSPLSAFNTPLAADPRDPVPAPQRSLDNLTGAVSYYESRGVPAAKIMLGIAFYGRGFNGVSSRDDGLYSKYTAGYEETPWKTIRAQFLTSPDWVRHWSATAQAPWLYNPKKHIFFTYDDPRSLGIKADFARRQQLRGLMIWVLGEDDPGNSLLQALTSHLAPQGSPQHARN
ncbi:MAG TPA: glycosyl hydrolase family 18 protein [Steroidobacteraceae bacterium]|nr:glycosyl hydrolase family 18 protein [Steroidobacteraceae bacterium]